MKMTIDLPPPSSPRSFIGDLFYLVRDSGYKPTGMTLVGATRMTLVGATGMTRVEPTGMTWGVICFHI